MRTPMKPALGSAAWCREPRDPWEPETAWHVPNRGLQGTVALASPTQPALSHDLGPGSSVTLGDASRKFAPIIRIRMHASVIIQGRSRIRTYGSERGALGDQRPYRDRRGTNGRSRSADRTQTDSPANGSQPSECERSWTVRIMCSRAFRRVSRMPLFCIMLLGAQVCAPRLSNGRQRSDNAAISVQMGLTGCQPCDPEGSNSKICQTTQKLSLGKKKER
jgi:hypothetical protein